MQRLTSEMATLRAQPPVERVVEKIVEKPVDRVVEKVVEKTIDNPAQALRIAALTAEVATIATLRSRITMLESAPPKVVEKVVEKPVEIDLAAARAAGFSTIKGEDDLEIVEGIGPKIAELFHAKGVKTFAQLAAMTPAQIQPMLDEAGPNFRLANPETWPDQADLAARNRWAALKAMQDGLTAGNRKA